MVMRVQVPPSAPYHIAELCKGSTSDSDSLCMGSNPISAATSKGVFGCISRACFLFCIKISTFFEKIYVVSFLNLWYTLKKENMEDRTNVYSKKRQIQRRRI